jgi:glycosylphosphatidylinositol transamidase (GPIT) subunit GPI8
MYNFEKISKILLFLPESTACNSQNNDPGVVSPFDGSSQPNLYRNVEIDFVRDDVNVRTFSEVLRGRYSEFV